MIRRVNNRARAPIPQKSAKPVERHYPAQDPSVFAGPAVWMHLHSTAAAYDGSTTQKNAFIKLVQSIQDNFPCERCRRNLVKHLKELPLGQYLGNRDELFLWTYLMHDKVNKLKQGISSTDPQICSPPLDEIKKYYFESLNLDCSNCSSPQN